MTRSTGVMIALAALVLVMATLWALGAFAADEFLTELNKKWPAKSEWAERAQRAQQARDGLTPTATWDAYLSLSSRTIVTAISKGIEQNASSLEKKGITIKSTSVQLEDQAILVTADITAEIADPKMRVTAKVRGLASPAFRGGQIEIGYALRQIELTRLVWLTSEPTDLAVAMPVVQAAVDRFLDNLNGSLAPTTITIPIGPIQSIGPNDSQANTVRMAGSKLVPPQPRLVGGVLLISQNNVRALLDLDLAEAASAGETDPTPPMSPDVDEEGFNALYSDLLQRFEASVTANLEQAVLEPSAAMRVAIARTFLAKMLNSTVRNIDWTISIEQPRSQQSFNSEVRLFKVPDAQSCERKKDERDCATHRCERRRDTRDCSACLVRKPWPMRGCAVRGNDPACEVAKAAQNTLYDGATTLCEADAARLKSECEVAKAGQNTLYNLQTEACRAGNEIVQTLANFSGRVGRVSGTVAARSGGVARVQQLAFGDKFESVSLTAQISAASDIDATISFVQSDLVGHLLCQFPVNNTKIKARAQVGPDQIVFTADITSDEDKSLYIRTRPVSLHLSVRPKPVDALFEQNKELYITCSGARELAWLGSGLEALGAKNLPEAFTGETDLTIGEQTLEISLPPVSVRELDLTLKPLLLPSSLVLESQ